MWVDSLIHFWVIDFICLLNSCDLDCHESANADSRNDNTSAIRANRQSKLKLPCPATASRIFRATCIYAVVAFLIICIAAHIDK